MKGIKNYLLAVVISLTTVSLYGNPEIALYRISEEVKNHTVQRSVLAFIRQIFEAIDRGEVSTEEKCYRRKILIRCSRNNTRLRA